VAAIAIQPETAEPAAATSGPNSLPEAELIPEAEKTAPKPRLKGKPRPGQDHFGRQLPPEMQGPAKDPARAEPGSAADPASPVPEERQLKPVILSRPAIEPGSPALARERPAAEEKDDALSLRTIVLCLGGVFMLVFFFLARALRRGPGGDGLSLD
jgi:hypothetical protein